MKGGRREEGREGAKKRRERERKKRREGGRKEGRRNLSHIRNDGESNSCETLGRMSTI